ncbi:MAG: hypothetical protein ACO3EK_08815, partial [Alphaproteobacteria bacterium]
PEPTDAVYLAPPVATAAWWVSSSYGGSERTGQTALKVATQRLCAALMGMLVKGLGADHVVWGTDAVWTGSPQWQIEALRRLEIPEDMQRRHGFAPLGPADGPVKRAIFGENSASMYRYDVRKAAWRNDAFAALKERYLRDGAEPSNLRYGYVVG